MPTRSAAVAAVLLAGLAAACARRAPAYGWTDASRDYVRLVVALGERDPDSLDAYFGPPSVVADIRQAPPSLPAIRAQADALAARVRGLACPTEDDRARRRLMLLQLTAIARRVDVVTGAHLPFDEESRGLFGTAAPHGLSNRPGPAAARTEIDRLLRGPGDLAGRYDRFDRAFAIPPGKLRAVFGKAIEGCRARTAAHVDLPAGEQVTLELVGNRPWSAFSRYQGAFRSLVQVNADFGWTVDRALETACHETYPGHHVRSIAIDRAFVAGRGWTELTAQPFFSPAALVAEGTATLAAELAFPGDERERFERDVLFPAAGLDPGGAARYVAVERLVDRLAPVETDIARRYVDGALEFVRAGDALRMDALMAHPEAALKYINEYRTYVLTYAYAPQLVARWLDEYGGGTPEGRWKAYAGLASPVVDLELLDRSNRHLP